MPRRPDRRALLQRMLVAAAWALPGGSRATSADSLPLRRFLADTIGKPPPQRQALGESALAAADAALAREPSSVPQHLLKVASLGAVARSVTPARSLAQRYGSRSKAAIDALLALAPREPWALAFAGIWNFEVERRGGSMGRLFLGASLERGATQLREARAAAPGEPGIPFAHAVTLLSLDAAHHGGAADALLDASLSAAQRNADDPVSAPVQDHAPRLRRLLAEGDAAHAGALALVLM